FQTTVAPTLLKKEDILKIVHWIAPAKKYVLQNFKGGQSPYEDSPRTVDPKFEKIKPYSKDFLFSLQKIISPFFEIVQVR
ncbi:unnamed protein product, partial [marine sediment metagenome]